MLPTHLRLHCVPTTGHGLHFSLVHAPRVLGHISQVPERSGNYKASWGSGPPSRHLHINRQNPGWALQRGKAQPGNLFLVALHSAFFMLCSPITVRMYNQEVNLQPGFLLTYWWNNQFQRIKCHGFFFLVNKWWFSGWYHGPDVSICLLGHWLLKLCCSGAFQQELPSGSWVTFQGNSHMVPHRVPWCLQPDAVGRPSKTTHQPLVSDLARDVMPKAAMLKRWCFLCNPYLFFLRGSDHASSLRPQTCNIRPHLDNL